MTTMGPSLSSNSLFSVGLEPASVPAAAAALATARQNAELTQAIERERFRLWRYVRRRVNDDADAEDLLQDVFGELLEAYRALKPIEQLGAWMLRVARNRLIDRFRSRRPEDAEPAEGSWEELLPDPGAGPEAALARSMMLEEFGAALETLPVAQREAFVAHELEGESFSSMSARTGIAVNTLLSRKHYAVRYLRERLRMLRDELLEPLE
jgi:RNA polymerase sigma factor (sigma-70 family)